MKKGFLQGGKGKEKEYKKKEESKAEKKDGKESDSSPINLNTTNLAPNILPKSTDLGIDKLPAPKPGKKEQPQRPSDHQPPPPSLELNAALATLFAPKTLERYQKDPMFQELVGEFEEIDTKTTLSAGEKLPVPIASNTTSTSTTSSNPGLKEQIPTLTAEGKKPLPKNYKPTMTSTSTISTSSGLKEQNPTLSAEGKKPLPKDYKPTSFKQLIEFYDEETFVSTKAQATFLAHYFPLFESYERTISGMLDIKEKAKKVHESYDKRLKQYSASLEEARFLNKELNSRLSLACDEVGRDREWFKKLEADLAGYKLIIKDKEEIHAKEIEQMRASSELSTRRVKFLEKEIYTLKNNNIRVKELEDSEGKLKEALLLQTQKSEQASLQLHDFETQSNERLREHQQMSSYCVVLKKEKEDLEGKLKEALFLQTQQSEKASLKLHDFETQSNELQRKHHQLSSYCKELKEAILGLRAENVKLKVITNGLHNSNSELRDELLSKEETIVDQRKMLLQVPELESVIHILTEASFSQTQELEKSSLQVHNLQTQLDLNQGQREIEKAAWRTDLTELQTHIGKLKQRILDLESDAKSLEEHCKNIETDKIVLQEELRKLKEKLKMMKAGAEIYEKKRKDDFDDYFTTSKAIITELAEGYKEDRRKDTELTRANFELTLHETMLLRKEAHGFLEKTKAVDHALTEVLQVKKTAENMLEQTSRTFSLNAFTTETYYNTKPRKIVQDMFKSEIFPVIDKVTQRDNAQAESFRQLKEDIYKAHLRITELKEGLKEKKKNDRDSFKEEREAARFSKEMKSYVEKPEKILDLTLEGRLGEKKYNTLTKFNFRLNELPIGFIFRSSFGDLTVSEHFNPSRKLGYSAQRTQSENEIQNLYNMMGNQGRPQIF